jgi:RNA polymerase sigma-70 factor, ECF subfamily
MAEPLMEETLDSVLSQNQPAGAKSLQTIQEVHWVRASQQGDVVAFNRLVLKWEKPIYNLSLRMLQDPDEAAEATQEVFLSAFKSIRRFRNKAKFSTWLYRIACNHCLSRLRQRPPGVQYSLDDASPENPIHRSLPVHDSHEREVLNEEGRRRVRLALEYLSPDQKAVVELRFFQELTLEEIAVIVQLPLGTIKSRLYAGLEALKIKLGRSSLKATRR